MGDRDGDLPGNGPGAEVGMGQGGKEWISYPSDGKLLGSNLDRHIRDGWRTEARSFYEEDVLIMKITRLGETEKKIPQMEGASGIYKQLPISKHDGSPAFSFRVFTFDPGGHTPFHRHPNEHINYVIEGSGVIVTEDGDEREIRKGDFVLILPNEKHQYRNTSTSDPMIMICAVPKEYE